MPFNEHLSKELKLLSSKISDTKFGKAKLISNLLSSSKHLFYKQLALDYEKKNPLALYPTSSYRNSCGHVVSSNDYQQIEATMNLNTFTSIKVEENTLDINNQNCLIKNTLLPEKEILEIENNINNVVAKIITLLSKIFIAYQLKMDVIIIKFIII